VPTFRKATLLLISIIILSGLTTIGLFAQQRSARKKEKVSAASVAKSAKSTTAKVKRPLTVYRSATTVEILNSFSAPSSPMLPEVSSVHSLVLQLRINEFGKWKADRTTHVLVAVYERPTESFYKVGSLLATRKDSNPVVTIAGSEQQLTKNVVIPLQPGEYIFKVFVCDGKEPYDLKRHVATFPPAEHFPGLITTSTTGLAHIQ